MPDPYRLDLVTHNQFVHIGFRDANQPRPLLDLPRDLVRIIRGGALWRLDRLDFWRLCSFRTVNFTHPPVCGAVDAPRLPRRAVVSFERTCVAKAALRISRDEYR